MKVLVTGAAGFIAARVVELLVQEGHDVTAIDNFNDAYDVRLKEWRAKHGSVPVQRIDVTDKAAVRALGRFDAIFNLAARAGIRQSVENPWVFIDTNVTGTLNLLELTPAKFILASTSSLYGAAPAGPCVETAATDRVLTPYAASKKAAEALCHSYHHLRGIDVSILRFFTVYGPAGRPDMSLFRFVQWISEERPVIVYGDGTQSRDFTYVDDVARGVALAMRPIGYEIINLGSDSPWVLNDTIALIEDLVGKKAHIDRRPRHAADVMASWANVDKARALLGWTPQVDARTGITRMVDWYRDNRAWAREIATT